VREKRLRGAQRNYQSNPDKERTVLNYIDKEKKKSMNGLKCIAIWKTWSSRFYCRQVTSE
jgi:hypothetical protein